MKLADLIIEKYSNNIHQSLVDMDEIKLAMMNISSHSLAVLNSLKFKEDTDSDTKRALYNVYTSAKAVVDFLNKFKSTHGISGRNFSLLKSYLMPLQASLKSIFFSESELSDEVEYIKDQFSIFIRKFEVLKDHVARSGL
jgi:hypothetical protein